MKKFIDAEIEIVRINVEDVVTASGEEFEDTENGGGWA